MIRAATSRTCPTEPGAPDSSAACERLHGVDHARVGRLAGRASRGRVSRSVSASTGTSQRRPAAEPLGAQADLLGGLLAADVQRAAARAAAGAPSTMLVSVDLPIPGEPPSSTSEPGTSPPPSTRSSSPMPGRHARHGARADLSQRRACAARARAAGAAARRAPAAARRARPAARSAHALLDEGVPRLAAGALPVPLGGLRRRTGSRRGRWCAASRAEATRAGRGRLTARR